MSPAEVMMLDILSLGMMATAFALLARAAHGDGRYRRAWILGFFALATFSLAGRGVNALSGPLSGSFSGALAVTIATTLRDLAIGCFIGALFLSKTRRVWRAFFFPGAVFLALWLGSAWIFGVSPFANTGQPQANSSFASPSKSSDPLARIQDQNQDGAVDGELILELGDDDRIDELQGLLQKFEAKADKAFPRFENLTALGWAERATLNPELAAIERDLAQTYIVRAPLAKTSALLAALRADRENVDHAEPSLIMTAPLPQPQQQEQQSEPSSGAGSSRGDFLANDPHLQQQWGFQRSDGDVLHRKLESLKANKPAIVAIVDTGVDSRHEDIRAVFESSPGDRDGNGHGTHCAGIAGAATHNGIGVASYNWAGRFVRIRGYKALSDSGSGSSETVAQGILDAARDGADVISLSLGGYSPTPPRVTVKAVQFALRRGAIVVVAAGNSDSDAKNFSPANIDGVITVAALDQDLRKARFSNTVSSVKLGIAAPGVAIHSLKTGGGYFALSGTSMATPMVAGLIGVLRALNPQLSTQDAWSLLHETGSQGPDASRVGRGINASKALELSLQR